jgi:hypothetical protein
MGVPLPLPFWLASCLSTSWPVWIEAMIELSTLYIHLAACTAILVMTADIAIERYRLAGLFVC